MKPEYRTVRTHPGHICQADPEERRRIVEQIRNLTEKLGNASCVPRPPLPATIDFICEKQPRFMPDPEDVPVITHVPLLEFRPTSDYRKLKKTAYQWRNIYFVPVDPPQKSLHQKQNSKSKYDEVGDYKRVAVMDHDELTCHAVGERRINYLNQIKCILAQMDDTPCTRKCPKNRKPLIEYPGYLNRKNPDFKKSFYQPLIVNLPIREHRPTSEYWKHAHENDENLRYHPVVSKVQAHSSPPWKRPRYNSFELVAGEFLTGCDCSKHNGLQDQCRRRDCGGGPKCRTEPTPSCLPSQTIPSHIEKALEEKYREALAEHPPREKMYCCCNPGSCGLTDPRSLPKGFVGKPCPDH